MLIGIVCEPITVYVLPLVLYRRGKDVAGAGQFEPDWRKWELGMGMLPISVLLGGAAGAGSPLETNAVASGGDDGHVGGIGRRPSRSINPALAQGSVLERLVTSAISVALPVTEVEAKLNWSELFQMSGTAAGEGVDAVGTRRRRSCQFRRANVGVGKSPRRDDSAGRS